MTSIENLFDWILEDIFVKLTRRDRIICKEVCKRWYDILMESVKFREDRHIYILTNQIEIPLNVLMQAPKPYQIYTVSGCVFEKNRDIVQLFERVGAFIEEFNYKGNADCWDILSTMPSLKCLTSDRAKSEDAKKIFSKIKSNKPDFSFRHLEKLHLAEVRELNKEANNIKILKEFIPKNCSITFSYAFVYDETSVENLCQIIEVAKFKKITCEFTVKEKILEVEGNILDCDVFELLSAGEENPYSFLQVLQTKYEKLKNIELNCSVLPPVDIEWPKITSLSLEVFGSSLKSLEKLINLEKLSLKSHRDMLICGFGSHEPLNLPKLKHLELDVYDLCGACHFALHRSFEDLESYKIQMAYSFWSAIQLSIYNWKKLTTVHLDLSYDREIDYGGEDEDEEDEENSSFPPKDTVKQLIILNIRSLKKKDIEKISEAFPNLERIQLYTMTWSDSSKPNIIRSMLDALPKLKSFYFSINEQEDEKKIIIFNAICQRLRTIGFSLENETASKEAFMSNGSIFLNIDWQKMTFQISENPQKE